MKSWANLKGSMEKISDQVRQILFVRNDLAMMQDDLTTQEHLWAEAEKKMRAENAQLNMKLQQLQLKVAAEATLEYQVRQLEANLQHAKAEHDAAVQRLMKDQARADIETANLRKHEQDLFRQLAALNETITKEEADANDRKQQVIADGAVLQRKVAELEDTLKRAKAEALLSEQQDAAKELDLQRQLEEMKRGLKRMKGEVVPRAQLAAETNKLRAELQQETLAILKVQQDGAQMEAECRAEKSRREEVLRAEKGKADQRVEQKNQFCNAVQGQNAVLNQMVAACQLKGAK